MCLDGVFLCSRTLHPRGEAGGRAVVPAWGRRPASCLRPRGTPSGDSAEGPCSQTWTEVDQGAPGTRANSSFPPETRRRASPGAGRGRWRLPSVRTPWHFEVFSLAPQFASSPNLVPKTRIQAHVTYLELISVNTRGSEGSEQAESQPIGDISKAVARGASVLWGLREPHRQCRSGSSQ